LFYTTGEIVRRTLPSYTPYAAANGLWKRAWPMYLDPLERDWRLYLDGKAPFNAAISAIVKEVGKPKNSQDRNRTTCEITGPYFRPSASADANR
jgi:hypothetical protein